MEMDKKICSQLISNSPTGMLLLDPQRRVQWLNPALSQLIGVATAELIGKGEQELQQLGLSGLVRGDGLMHLLVDGEERWLQCNTSADGLQNYFQDVTELLQLRETVERLRQQVKDLAITDELTGLANRQALFQALTAQVTRSRRYHNPLSLALIDLQSDGAIADELLLAVSRYLRDRLRWVDVIGRWEERRFMVILPETGESDSRELLEKIQSEFLPGQVPEAVDISGVRLGFGLAEWQKGFDARKLLQQATDALQPQADPA